MMRILEMLFVAIVSAVRDGQKVSIKNFGTFSLRHLPGRKMANPFNEGVELSYGDRKVMAFRQAVATKRFMNRKDHSQEKRRPLARKGASDE